AMAKGWQPMEGLELASKVSRKEAQTVHSDGPFKIAAFDYGIKQNIINNFQKRGCTLRIFPAKGDYLEELKQWNPDGFFFSNGPGDPNETAHYALKVVEHAKETGKPIFGICLG